MIRYALLAAPLLLTACSGEPEPVETPSPSATAVGPRTLVSAGFNDQELGPRIVGPQGDEVRDTIAFEGMPVAELISYVACPAAGEGEEPLTECKPDAMPEGTLYTYVHRLISTGADKEAQPFLLRITKPANGFANVIGFDRAQAEMTLGEGYSIATHSDAGRLEWRIEAGDGFDKGEELTLFWQSTLPPAGPAKVYEIESNTGTAPMNGPFPPEENSSENEGPGN